MPGTILEISDRLRRREISPVELTWDCLQRVESLNPRLNAFITVTADSALSQARTAETEIQRGVWRGPLHGIPLGLKDLIDTAGIRTTAASALFKDRIPQADAEVVRKLKAAGAVLLGKQNLHELAYGGSSIISYYGAVHNPWNTAYITGGSSGGSAAAVSAGMCYGAIGTDTAGSVREPAALCSLVGLKPTFGRVSTTGVIPLSASLDHIGPIARTVSDAAVIFEAIAGFDANDVYSVDKPVDDYVAALHDETRTWKVGVPRKFFYEELDSEVASAVEDALGVLKTKVAEIREIELDVPTDRTLQLAESYAHYAELMKTRAELLNPATAARLRAGENIAADEVVRLQRELAATRRNVSGVFESIDLLVTPTTPIPAAEIAELQQNPDLLRPRELSWLRNTRPFNVWGLPAISVPCGFTSSGLPIGMQIAGPHLGESKVLALAHAYEQATEWHKRRPNV